MLIYIFTSLQKFTSEYTCVGVLNDQTSPVYSANRNKKNMFYKHRCANAVQKTYTRNMKTNQF